MKRCCGFSLIELLIGLSIFSVLIIVMGKIHSAVATKQARVTERRLLLPCLDAFEHFLSQLIPIFDNLEIYHQFVKVESQNLININELRMSIL